MTHTHTHTHIHTHTPHMHGAVTCADMSFTCAPVHACVLLHVRTCLLHVHLCMHVCYVTCLLHVHVHVHVHACVLCEVSVDVRVGSCQG